MPERIADTLVLTFTTGVSLQTWHETGVLAREWALYEAISPRYDRIVLVTYGGGGDIETARGLGGGAAVEVVSNEGGLPAHEFVLKAPEVVASKLSGTRSAVVKTNQMDGGEAALGIARRLREGGARVGVIARGGYHWSMFVARQAGASSQAAMNAGTLERTLCRGSDVVVGTTQRMVEDLWWRHGLPADRARVIPNYVLPVQGSAPERERGLVLSAGRLHEQKRFDVLIDAMALVRQKAPEAWLQIVGSGELEAQLRQKASASGVRVEFLGQVKGNELQERMRRCAVYAQVSAYEGHPKTLIEAQASACATVVTDSPGLGETVRHNETGLIAEHSAADIARRIVQLLADDDLRTRLGAEAARAARSAYSLEHVVELEQMAHRDALSRGSQRGEDVKEQAPVRWEPDLLSATVQGAVGEWARSLNGFTRRLSARRRAEFLMALDEPLYLMQGRAAIEANGGLHPKHHLMRYHDFFVERIAPGERVIDLGSGVGAVACSIAERSGASVVGVDIDKENVAAAEARARVAGLSDRVQFVHGDITTHRVEGTFDVVILSNVLEHVANRPALLRMWSDWYRPSRILIRVPAFDRDWRTGWKRELGLEWRLDDTHEIEYTLESLRSEVRAAGLAISEQIANWGEYWIVTQDAARVEAAR